MRRQNAYERAFCDWKNQKREPVASAAPNRRPDRLNADFVAATKVRTEAHAASALKLRKAASLLPATFEYRNSRTG